MAEARGAHSGNRFASERLPRSVKLLVLLPAAVGILLSLPGFDFAYIFDDYDFLGRAQTFEVRHLLPDPNQIFYRPVSREIYFGFLNWLSPESPFMGHLLNALLLGGILVMASTLVGRLAGWRAGLLSGIVLACFGQWPVLVAWVSGVQDLMAIAATLAALNLQLMGRRWSALIALSCAILSKETAAAAIPALLLMNAVSPQPRSWKLVSAVGTAAVLVAWTLFHPGLHLLLERGEVSPMGSYIGLANPERWGSLLKSIPTLVNAPLKFPTSWPSDMNWALGLALLPFARVIWGLSPHGNAQLGSIPHFKQVRMVAVLGLALGILPLLLTCFLVQEWLPYYACFAAVGLSVAAGALLSASRFHLIAACLCLYLLLGFWSRGVELKPGTPTERGLAPAGRALRQVERNFKQLAPKLPAGSLVYVTTMVGGAQSVYHHLHNFQALRIWYGDPTLHTLRPELRVASSAPEFLFAVLPDLHVLQIKPRTLVVRTTGGPVEHRRVRSVLRSYAIGLSSVGEVERAVGILLRIDDSSSGDGVVNRRIAAMLLLSRGERASAYALLQGVPQLRPVDAIEAVGMLLTVPTPGVHLEEHAMEAFGLSSEDPKVLKPLLRGLLQLGHHEVALRIADRILAVDPEDPEANQARQSVPPTESIDRVTEPARRLDFPGN